MRRSARVDRSIVSDTGRRAESSAGPRFQGLLRDCQYSSHDLGRGDRTIVEAGRLGGSVVIAWPESGIEYESSTRLGWNNPRADSLAGGMASKMDPVRPLITLVVPVWGDDNLVVDLVNGLRVTPELAEWVVVAVSPAQRLCDLDRRGVIRLITCDQPSRGRQMNAGAAAAHGTLLCFHHCDSELRDEHICALARTARDEMVLGGAFHRRFDDRRFWMKWRQPLVRWLHSLGGPLFGDQSIFVKASVFQRMGGFADIPLMEDLEFSRRLRRLGPVALLDPPLWSSPRRFQRLGVWWTTLINIGFICLFYIGVDSHRLHRWYYRLSWKRSNRQKAAPSVQPF
jgi:rSAM/selenodomain-associated transferase 2